MVDPKLTSKKRKRPTLTHHPLLGIFTRRKSHIHLHRHRSGCSWSDSFASRYHSKKPRSTPHSSPLLVKDLRSRRIFSDGFGLLSSNAQDKTTRDENDALLDSQTTPPDVDLFIAPPDHVNTIDRKDSISNGEGFSTNTDQRNATNRGIKPVLGPRPRTKLYKAPGSFSYRRLLPYLMDVSKDHSCASEFDQRPKIKKGLEEKPALTSLGQEILIDKCKNESNSVGDVNELNVESIECIKESSPWMSRDFSLASVDEWPQPVGNVRRETSDSKNCRKDQNLNDSKTGFSLNWNVSVSSNSGDAKSIDNGEAGDSCYTEHMNNSDCIMPLIMENCDHRDNEGDQCSQGTMQSKAGEACTLDVKEYSKDNDLCQTNSNDGLSNSEQRGEGDHGEVLDHNGQSDFLMTPPGADIFGKPEGAENGRSSVKSILSTADNDFLESMDGSINRNNSCLGEKSIDSSPSRKQDLGRCSRLKLFKVPGSMSYRRMLPFLIDVTKDNSCACGKDHRLKLKKCLEQKPTLPSVVYDNQEKPIESSDVNFDTKPDVIVCCATSSTISTSLLNDQESNRSYDRVKDSPKPCTSLQGREVHFEQEMSATERKLRTGPQMIHINDGSNPPALSLPSLLGSESLPKEAVKFVSNELSVYTGEDCTKSVIKITNGEKQTEIDSRDSTYLDTSFHSGVPTTALKKGILKRTPRGCRGLCTCLNCSSFRLNAERAFEFSSNQMLDAQEVALDLIKELSYMRNMLEKSTVGADGRAVVCINQVKEACNRASEAEELAQTRLSQMNFDLRVHCKMTCAERPRVRFANRVEEQVITYSDLPNK